MVYQMSETVAAAWWLRAASSKPRVDSYLPCLYPDVSCVCMDGDMKGHRGDLAAKASG